MFVVSSACGEKFIKIGDFDTSCKLEQDVTAASTSSGGELHILLYPLP